MKQTKHLLVFASLLLAFFIWAPNLFAQEGSVRAPELPACGTGTVLINEIDYDQPGADSSEFVELRGNPSALLDGFEIHFLSGMTGEVYHQQSLEGKRLSTNGYFIYGPENVMRLATLLEANNMLVLNSADSISNETPSGIGIYDVAAEDYCFFANYGGNVDGFESWLNIGLDFEEDGQGRGCGRSDSGWWSCDRIVTPGGSNHTVAVEMGAATTSSTSSILPILSAVIMLVGLTRRSVQKN